MIRISAYISDQVSAKRIGVLIASYLKKRKVVPSINIMTNIDEMVKFIDENDIDVFVIDFSSLEVGLELCNLIREKSMYPSIFAINVSPLEIGTRMFFRPSAILEDSNNIQEFIRVLDRLYLEKQLENRYFSFKCDGEIVRVPFEAIGYFESNAKVVTLFLARSPKKYCFASKLSEIEKMLPNSFLRCHQSYIVNMEHIARFDSTDLILISL